MPNSIYGTNAIPVTPIHMLAVILKEFKTFSKTGLTFYLQQDLLQQ